MPFNKMKKNLPIIHIIILLFTIVLPASSENEQNFLLRFDQDVFKSIYDEPPRTQFLGQSMEAATELGDGKVIMGISLLLLTYGDERMRETGRLLTSAFIGTGLTIYALKSTIRRERPVSPEERNSFPSGHTGFSFMTATVLACKYPQWRIPLYLLATTVGITRIYLGRHYPLDVLAGATIGTITAWQVVRHEDVILKWQF